MHKNLGHVVRHAAAYMLARGVPALISFLAIPLFTRLMNPEGYGKYALVATTVALINALFFQWIRLSFVRFIPAAKGEPDRLKSTVLTCQLLLIVIGGAITLGIIAANHFIPALAGWGSVAGICWLVLAVQPIFELFCEEARANIQPRYFMALQLARTSLTTGLGALLIKLGLGWWGPLLGMFAGNMLPAIYAYRRGWLHTHFQIDREVLAKVCAYGIPLSLTVGLAFVIGSSDRYLIAYFLGDAAAGVYSVAVDFTSQTLTLLLMTVSMAIVPLAMLSWENNDHERAREQMRHNSALLLAIGIPAVIGLMVLAPNISHCFLGKTFRADAASIMPIIALGTFLSGYKAYYLDTAFQFVHQTIYQVWIVLFAAIVNIALNLVMIRPFGIIGAAGASVIAYLISMALTAYYGRRHFALPFPTLDFIQVLTAGGVMALLLYVTRDMRGGLALVLQVFTGGALYAIILVALNFLGLRAVAVNRLLMKRRTEAPQPVSVAAAP